MGDIWKSPTPEELGLSPSSVNELFSDGLDILTTFDVSIFNDSLFDSGETAKNVSQGDLALPLELNQDVTTAVNVNEPTGGTGNVSLHHPYNNYQSLLDQLFPHIDSQPQESEVATSPDPFLGFGQDPLPSYDMAYHSQKSEPVKVSTGFTGSDDFLLGLIGPEEVELSPSAVSKGAEANPSAFSEGVGSSPSAFSEAVESSPFAFSEGVESNPFDFSEGVESRPSAFSEGMEVSPSFVSEGMGASPKGNSNNTLWPCDLGSFPSDHTPSPNSSDVFDESSPAPPSYQSTAGGGGLHSNDFGRSLAMPVDRAMSDSQKGLPYPAEMYESESGCETATPLPEKKQKRKYTKRRMLSGESKAERKKSQNRIAAIRYRNKQKAEKLAIHTKWEEATEKNLALKKDLKEAKRKLAQLDMFVKSFHMRSS